MVRQHGDDGTCQGLTYFNGVAVLQFWKISAMTTKFADTACCKDVGVNCLKSCVDYNSAIVDNINLHEVRSSVRNTQIWWLDAENSCVLCVPERSSTLFIAWNRG